MANSTGYGPSNADKWRKLTFNGDGEQYEIWEIRFLSHLRTLNIRDVIVSQEPPEVAGDVRKNERGYAELVNLLDDKSLALIMRDAPDDGRRALQILRSHYAGCSKPRVITLYTELTRLTKDDGETITDYIIKAEKVMTALRNAGENLSDSLMVAMTLKGLPDSYKPFTVNVTQSQEEITFPTFKAKLRSFEEIEKLNKPAKADNVMATTNMTQSKETLNQGCFNCHRKGHFARECPQKSVWNPDNKGQKMWCSYHNSTTHSNENCRANKRRHDAKGITAPDIEQRASLNEEPHSFAFMASGPRTQEQGLLMVDTGATSHIITRDIVKPYDPDFDPSRHFIELADGTRKNNIVEKIGDAEVILQGTKGNIKVTLKNVLYIPSYPQDIFSAKAAVHGGAEIQLKEGDNKMIKNGTTFNIVEHNRLYYLQTVEDNMKCKNKDKVNIALDVNEWHNMLGHCNFDDVLRLESVVDGMKIKDKASVDKTKLKCNTCTQGKFVNTRNRGPDAKAQHPLDLVHTDLAGPINVTAKDGFKYAISFTDDYSGCIFIYLLRNKSDTVQATKQFLADCAPYGSIKCLRSDNGGEFTSDEFQALMRDKGIRHDTSSPYSPHQNGTAERHWRTIFEMGRCLLIDSGLPKTMWAYAVKIAAFIRNRCYNNRIGKTPYQALTGVKPDVSKMGVFGSECYTYSHNHTKLDAKCKKGIFVGYDQNSPAYLVYYPMNGKVLKHRLIKFLPRNIEQCTQTDHNTHKLDTPTYDPQPEADLDIPAHETQPDDDLEIPNNDNIENHQDQNQGEQNIPNEGIRGEEEDHGHRGRYPQRERSRPQHLDDYVTDFEQEVNDDYVHVHSLGSVDSCYKAYGVPQGYSEAQHSPNASDWQQAMTDEFNSLKAK